ncbi:MAG: LacI family transcriptional regulator [Firmicutes bacterium HGW-Firmicutes-7]|nr:MAG: LacI family transcriptional regulator [Firmicutes bacterium HGW-Firmicutes-7]
MDHLIGDNSVKVTITDIAKMGNVSVATVSRVINNKAKGVSDENRVRILGIIDKYNFQPSAVARGLVTKKSNIIGLIIPDISNPYYTRLAKAVEDEVNEKGYNVILCDGSSSEKVINYLDFLNKHYVSGIVYTNIHCICNSILDKLTKSSLPVVFLDLKSNISNSRSVYIDNKKAMYDLMCYLISVGHKDIALMTGPIDSYSTSERYKGYIQALEEYQIPLDEALIIEGDFSIEKGYETMGKLLDRKKSISVVACCNDLMAIGAINMLEDSGIKVPDEISIVGFDNIEMSRIIRPKLTTVAQPNYEMGREAARMVIDIIEGNSNMENGDKVFEAKLLIRDSVKNLNSVQEECAISI